MDSKVLADGIFPPRLEHTDKMKKAWERTKDQWSQPLSKIL